VHDLFSPEAAAVDAGIMSGTAAEPSDPNPIKLARHVARYGTEGAEPWLHLLLTRGTTSSILTRSCSRNVSPRGRRSSRRSLECPDPEM
jgi:hypothetical protein